MNIRNLKPVVTVLPTHRIPVQDQAVDPSEGEGMSVQQLKDDTHDPPVGIGTGSAAANLHVAISEGSLPTLTVVPVAILQHNAVTGNIAAFMILAGESGKSAVYFSDSGNQQVGVLEFDHSVNHFLISIGGTERFAVTPLGAEVKDGNLHVTDGAGVVPTINTPVGILIQNNDVTGAVSHIALLGGSAGFSRFSAMDEDSDTAGFVQFNHTTREWEFHQAGNFRVAVTPQGLEVVEGALTLNETTAEPPDPTIGGLVTWHSNGTGFGDAGDGCAKSNPSGTVLKTIWHDHSAGSP